MSSHLTAEEIRAIVKETVQQTLNETFVRLGVAIDDPIEVQKDFQHLRDWRVTTDAVKNKAMLASIGLLVSGALAAIWVGIKDSVR